MKSLGAKPQILCIRKNLPGQLLNDRNTPLLVVSQNKHPTFNMLDLIHKGEVQSSFKRQVKKFKFISESESQEDSIRTH